MRISRVSRIRSLWPQSTTPIIAIAVVLTAASPALAQSDPPSGGGTAPPTREGNIYDHRDHQPTEAEVRAAERAGGTASPSSDTKRQVEDEVRQLLQQTDRLDKQSEQQDQDYPSGSSSGPKGGR
jgi:hypothetical protein